MALSGGFSLIRPMGQTTIRSMEYLVLDALPPESLATPLKNRLIELEPDLPTRLSGYKSVHWLCSPLMTGCTPIEYHLLRRHGWTEQICPQPAGALAAFNLGVQSSQEPVWAAQMCATQITPQSASLVDLDPLSLTQADKLALCQAVEPYLGQPGDDLWVQIVKPDYWQIHAPGRTLDKTISPAAMAGQRVSDWWPSDQAWLPWRRLLNEIQMVWHAHPVNEQRLENGLLPINNLWLYGGSFGWVIQQPTHPIARIDTLTPMAQNQNWYEWTQSWIQVVLPLLSQPNATVTLAGQDRVVTLQTAHPVGQSDAKPSTPTVWEHLTQFAHRLKSLAPLHTSRHSPSLQNSQHDWSRWWHNPS